MHTIENSNKLLIEEPRPTITSDLGPFGIVQRRVAGVVTPSSFAVYALLCTYADRESMSCFPSVKTLCRAMGMKESTMRRALKELEATGVITIQRNPLDNGEYAANTYHIRVVGPKDARNDPPVISGGTPCHPSTTNYTSELYQDSSINSYREKPQKITITTEEPDTKITVTDPGYKEPGRVAKGRGKWDCVQASKTAGDQIVRRFRAKSTNKGKNCVGDLEPQTL